MNFTFPLSTISHMAAWSSCALAWFSWCFTRVGYPIHGWRVQAYICDVSPLLSLRGLWNLSSCLSERVWSSSVWCAWSCLMYTVYCTFAFGRLTCTVSWPRQMSLWSDTARTCTETLGLWSEGSQADRQTPGISTTLSWHHHPLAASLLALCGEMAGGHPQTRSE